MHKKRTQLIIELRQRGFSYGQISHELNVNKSLISYVCQKHIPNNNKITESWTNKIREDRLKYGFKKAPNIKYTDDELKEAVRTSITLLEITKKLKQKTSRRIKKDLVRLNLDTSHLIGKAWRQLNWGTDDIPSLKMKIGKKQGHICAICHNSKWEGRPIPLDLHHKDEDSSNNDPDNLLLICPNCHAQKHHYVEDWSTYSRPATWKKINQI